MAGKKDIVEQALKLIAGGSDDAAKRIASIRRSEPFPADYIEPGSVRYRYEHPDTSSFMEIVTRPKGARSASVIGLEVPEEYRGTGIGKALQERVLQDYPSLMGQVSSKAAAVNAYKAGRRPLANPNATIEDVFKIIDEDSSVNLATPKNTGGSIREGYGPGGWVDDVVKMAGKVISGEGEEATKAFRMPRVRPPTDNIHDVGSANFDYYDIVGNKTMPIKDVFGGVDLSMPDQRARVDALKAAMSDPEKGYISRIIVDDEGNVIEGQHRFDAFRELGASEIPVTMLRDRSRGVDVGALKSAIQQQGGIHPDQTSQIVDMILEGNPEDYEPPQGFEKWWNAGVNEYNKQRGRIAKGGGGGFLDDALRMAGKAIFGEGEDAAKAGIRAYQGSPHNFAAERLVRFPTGKEEYLVGQPDVLPDVPEGAEVLQDFPLGRMRMDKIGTGEGAQAYGHGLYFAESEGVARSYRDALAAGVKPELRPTDKYSTVGWKAEAEKLFPNDRERQAAFHLFNQMKNKDYVLENHDFITSLPHNQGKPYEWEGVEFTRDRLAQLADEFYDPGHMYEVEINADPDTFLDWDKPLSEQSEAVKKVLRPMLGDSLEAQPGRDYQTGEQFYRDFVGKTGGRRDKLIEKYGDEAYFRNASDLANRELGIPGIKYLDAGSRGAGDGTRNYVVFDDKLISIIRKYGIAGASAMLGYNLMENLSPEQARAATQADNDYQSSSTYTGGMLPPGMEPSGEMTSRTPSASERIYDYVRSSLGGDEATKGQRAETIMNLIDQTPLAVGPMAYDIGRGVAEAVRRADGGYVDDDIDDAIRIAKDVGGSTPVMMEDAKGNKYDAQGNIIPPTSPGPNPARSDVTPQSVAAQAVNDPATYDALMERYAVPDRDIAEYEALKAAVSQQPQDIQQMTHVGDRPRREMTIDMPLFGGEYSMGTAPYDVAQGLQGAAQTAYDFKTMPAYFFPATAPFALGADVLESRLADDPLGFALNAALTPQGASAAKSALGAIRRNPKTTAAAIGAGAYLSPDEAEAGPERWFSKAMEVARAIPMEKMTGQQALAMLRKGVSPEELKWTGADVFLPQQKQITKQDLVDYLAKNRVQTQDVVFGGAKPARRDDVVPSETAIAPYKDRWDELVDQNRKINEVMLLPPSERDADIDDLLAQRNDIQYEMDQIHDKAVDATIEEMGGLGEPVRYGPGSAYGEKYVTPGGTNYRETLITLPQDLPSKERKLAELDAEATRLELAGDPRWRDVSRERGELMRSQGRSVYSSGHWEGVPNVAGHIRTQILDVTPPGANRPYKAFNVDEAQSDWAKAGREKGFSMSKEEYEKVEMQALISRERLLQHYENLPDRHRPTNEEIQSDISRMINGRLPIFIDPEGSAEPLVDAFMNDYKSLEKAANAIPTAPYVTSTQNWTDLSIKKALDQAMDAGADYFTYTPGEAQAKRYSLRNDVEGLAYDPEEKRLSYYPKNKVGWQDVRDTVEPSEIKKYVGEEAAKKLLAQEPHALSGNHILEGIDLEFGGEGMIDYYNNIYKKRVEKVVKDATGKKVQWEVIPVQTADGPREQLGFRLTDDMKEARFSDFNKGGRVADPVVNKALALTRY